MALNKPTDGAPNTFDVGSLLEAVLGDDENVDGLLDGVVGSGLLDDLNEDENEVSKGKVTAVKPAEKTAKPAESKKENTSTSTGAGASAAGTNEGGNKSNENKRDSDGLINSLAELQVGNKTTAKASPRENNLKEEKKAKRQMRQKQTRKRSMTCSTLMMAMATVTLTCLSTLARVIKDHKKMDHK
ncbi:hypothetical protein RFI_13819 [Reticulomyxa filosa]|uniref:Uncharacterized protein n=1 Tax=Reticulomyxa filosa TaxID=46433 RepID=X6NDH3_RETFI|nr:hypothetical protein RFI_13819 [Reticulomyxa filosa]|eukprot:ETO23362.1 hypothetical protein RFI_13819 [Reticulomyxa filosa]